MQLVKILLNLVFIVAVVLNITERAQGIPVRLPVDCILVICHLVLKSGLPILKIVSHSVPRRFQPLEKCNVFPYKIGVGVVGKTDRIENHRGDFLLALLYLLLCASGVK